MRLLNNQPSRRYELFKIDTIKTSQPASAAANSASKPVGGEPPGTQPTRQVTGTSVSSVAVEIGKSKSVTQFALQYDVRNMSPREMSAMSLELYQNGIISFRDHALLSFQPDLNPEFQEELLGTRGNADSPKDFIAHWETQLKLHQKSQEFDFAKNDQRMINLLGNLLALRVSATVA